MKKVAVILSGCGVFDGSEINEAVCTLLSIEQAGANYQCFAPNIDQHFVINHLTQEEMPEKRNVLVEAARIARGNIKDIKEASVNDFDAAIFPGGFGAATNISDFASKGADMSIQADVLAFAKAMKNAGKPQGFICISPVLISKIYGADIEQTIGNDESTAAVIEAMGGKHVDCVVDRSVIDQTHKVVSTPAYMLAKGVREAYLGINQLVNDVLKMG